MAGSPCPIETMKKVRTLMHMEQVMICYGMTETSHHSYQSDRLRFVKVKDRMEFEDRLVGLVREWMGSDDEVDYRRSVGHFAVVYEVALDDVATWPSEAAPPGFPPGETWIALSCSSRSDWINEALLREALDLVQGRRMSEPDDDEDESEDE